MSSPINITVCVLCRISKQNCFCFQFAEITIVIVCHGRGQDLAAATQVTCFDTAGRAVVFVSMRLIPAMHVEKTICLLPKPTTTPWSPWFLRGIWDKYVLVVFQNSPDITRGRYRRSCYLSFPILTTYLLFKIGLNLTCKDSNRNCSFWKRRGECRRNPAYMLVNCKRSCGWC